mmetsp:Transcript_26876/g.70598  ORF Transcript_26876/g.70598 Transcript_26876/m.70598 type:complete len:574 (+) Transcript_26876:46-1767(+)
MAGLLSWVGDALFGEEEGADATGEADANPAPEKITFPDEMVSKEKLYEIFAGFAAKVESSEGKLRLADAVKKGESVEDVTQTMQEEVCAALGLDGAEICSHFPYVLKYYADDTVLCEEFVKFCEAESNACDEAEMGPEKFQELQAKQKMEDESRARYRQEFAALPPPMRENMAKQLTMLTKRPEELDDMLAKTEANMRKVINKNPAMKKMIFAQLQQQFASVGAADELDESADVVKTMISKVKEGVAFMREQMQNEADSRGATFDEVLQDKLEALRSTAPGSAAPLPPDAAAAGAAAPGGAGAAATPPQLRFKVGDLILAKVGMEGENWQEGKVVAVGYREPHFPPGFVAPYQLQLKSGQLIFAPYDRDDIIRPRKAGAEDTEDIVSVQAGKEASKAELRFKVGDKVSARVSPTQFAPAVVVATHFSHPEMPPGVTVPYQIRVESTGDMLVAPHDVAEIICERGKEPELKGHSVGGGPGAAGGGGEGPVERRFAVGDRVEARVSMVPEKWLPATVESVNYREPQFPPNMCAPYRLKLDNGQLIFAPHDVDMVVRKPGGGGGSGGGIIDKPPGL